MFITRIIIVVILALVISVSGVVATTMVTQKTVEGNFSNITRNITLVNIATDRLGYLIYVEKYYLMDSSGALKYDKGVKYYEKNINSDRLILEISRPDSSSGKPYPAIMAIVMIDNQTVFQGWFKQYKQQKAGYQIVQPQESPLIQNENNQQTREQKTQDVQTKSVPGFEIIVAVFIISVIYVSKRFKEKRRDGIDNEKTGWNSKIR